MYKIKKKCFSKKLFYYISKKKRKSFKKSLDKDAINLFPPSLFLHLLSLTQRAYNSKTPTVTARSRSKRS